MRCQRLLRLRILLVRTLLLTLMSFGPAHLAVPALKSVLLISNMWITSLICDAFKFSLNLNFLLNSVGHFVILKRRVTHGVPISKIAKDGLQSVTSLCALSAVNCLKKLNISSGLVVLAHMKSVQRRQQKQLQNCFIWQE